VEEFLTLSCNFRIPVDVIVAGQHVVGKVEDIDDDRALIAGKWYPIGEINYASK